MLSDEVPSGESQRSGQVWEKTLRGGFRQAFKPRQDGVGSIVDAAVEEAKRSAADGERVGDCSFMIEQALADYLLADRGRLIA